MWAAKFEISKLSTQFENFNGLTSAKLVFFKTRFSVCEHALSGRLTVISLIEVTVSTPKNKRAQTKRIIIIRKTETIRHTAEKSDENFRKRWK